MAANIYICGDPHGRFQHIIEAVKSGRPDAILLLGDQTAQRPLHVELDEIRSLTEVYWIAGNHDTDAENYYDNLFASELADRNLHGRVTTIAGVRIAGVGGVFRTKVWDPKAEPDFDAAKTLANYMKTLGKGNLWRGGLPLRHRSTIFASDLYTLSKQTADVLVTHEAPGMHELGSPALTKLATSMRVSQAFHGHHHRDIVYAGGVWYGVGIQGIAALSGEIIVPGAYEHTHARSPETFP